MAVVVGCLYLSVGESNNPSTKQARKGKIITTLIEVEDFELLELLVLFVDVEEGYYPNSVQTTKHHIVEHRGWENETDIYLSGCRAGSLSTTGRFCATCRRALGRGSSFGRRGS